MSLTSSQIIFGYVAYYMNPIYILIFALRLLNIRYYMIQGDHERMNPVIRKLSPNIQTMTIKKINGREMNEGMFWSKNAIGFINVVGYEVTIHILSLPHFYKTIMTPDEIVNEAPTSIPSNKIDVYIRNGTYKHIYYVRTQLDITHISPMGQQLEVIESIENLYQSSGRATVFIHGKSCTGKSIVGYLPAKKMGANYCHTFNPSEPGDTLSKLLMEINRDCPTVIVMEEIDGILKNVHDNSIRQNSDIPILIRDKSSWCTFLDDMFLYKGLILILTSNTSKDEIDKMDDAYLRKGRIHETYCMNTKLNMYEN